MLKVITAQIKISENIEENYHKALYYIKEAAKHDGKVFAANMIISENGYILGIGKKCSSSQ